MFPSLDEPEAQPAERPSTPAQTSSRLGAENLLTPPSSAEQSGRHHEIENLPPTPPAPISPTFKGAKICVAIDVSASTYGDVLDAEKRATKAICKLIPLKLRPTINIVPWNDYCGAPIDLKKTDCLYSDGGTDPNVFLEDSTSRDFLQEADFWFLMTDGEIEESTVRKFARGLREYGLHGKACIICIFGEPEEKPAECNVTVGISVFAGSPHAAFLFNNVESGQTYILQTKGCFSALLRPGESAPRLDDDTSWEDLPRTSFENLSRVHIPPAVTVGANEIVLQDNSRLNMKAFLRDLPEDEKTVTQILDNEENLNAIAVDVKLRGETERLRSWLDRLDAKYGDSPQDVELESSTQASVAREPRSTLVTAALSKFGRQDDQTDDHDGHIYLQPPMSAVPGYGVPPQSTYSACYVPQMAPHILSSSSTQQDRRGSLGHMRRISLSGLEYAADNLGRQGPMQFPSMSSTSSGIDCAPGFSKPTRATDNFKGQSGCMECAKKDGILCLLLRAVSFGSTANFPSIGSQSMVIYPLTMGNYAETDILTSDIICDTCAARCVRRGTSKEDDRVIAALPLVSFSNNRTAWLETIDTATAKRFHISQIPMIFLSILYIKLEKLIQKDYHIFSDLCEGIKWIANALLSEVVLQATRLPEIDKFGIGALHDIILRSFTSTRSDTSYIALLQYPLDGFIVANAALSNSKQGQRFSGAKRKNVVYLKFLYHLTESFFKFRAENDSLVTEAAKSLILLSNEPTGPSSLFNWKEIREISILFKNPIELRKFFSQRGSYKLSITVNDLKQTPFLSKDDSQAFKRLGVLFNWITSQAAHATAVFVHHLFRTDIQGESVQKCFAELRNTPEIHELLKDPADISAKKADEMTKRLPPL